MKKTWIVIGFFLAFYGCSSLEKTPLLEQRSGEYTPTYIPKETYSGTSIDTLKSRERWVLDRKFTIERVELLSLKSENKEQQEQIDKLKKELEILTAELADLQATIESKKEYKSSPIESSYSAPTPTTNYSGNSTVYTGPRGGEYTISSSGKKVYKRKK